MRRFLGATNLSINTGNPSSTPSSSVDSSPSPSPRTPTPSADTALSSTKRAFQQTFGQLSYSRSNASSKSSVSRDPPTSHQKQVPSVSLSLPDDNTDIIEASSPVPPTPPSKHGHNEDDDGPAWDDDARSLPFGSSSLSRAPSSSASSSSPYEGLIGCSSNSHAEHNQDTTIVLQGSHRADSHQRNSTATISASRYRDQQQQPLSPSMQDYGNGGLGSGSLAGTLSSSTHLSNSLQSQPYNHTGLTVSATYAANASSLVDLKDEMMLELLSSDALIHVAQFEILGFDEVEELRKVSYLNTLANGAYIRVSCTSS